MSRRIEWATRFFLYLGALAAAGCSRSAADNRDVQAAKPADEARAAPEKTTPEGFQDGVMVYYFHGDRRCRTCLGIQAGVEQTIRERFGAEVAAGKLKFREVNYDQDANKALALQFQISFSSMVVARIKGGKTLEWENCDKVWEYAHEPKPLAAYVAERIQAYLSKAGAE
jgi:hypothetical protein